MQFLKMAIHKLLISFSCLLIAACSNAQPNQDVLNEALNLYRLHLTPKTWSEAVAACESEGRTLFYPENQEEALAVSILWKAATNIRALFIGVSLNSENNFVTADDGRPIEQVYHNWSPGEPNNAGGNEHCVELQVNSETLNDVNCDSPLPFICRAQSQSNKSDDSGYEHSPSLGKSYKFHLQPATWQDAFVTCSSEQASLAVITSQAEADHLAQITADAPKDSVSGGYLRGHVHLGILKIGQEWMTLKGSRLANSGYSRWGYGQPDNAGGHETCGGMFYSGELNDINCEWPCFFICEQNLAFTR